MMTTCTKYFGTDGIRGRVGVFPLTPWGAFLLGYASGQMYRQQDALRILIGRDTRGSGSALATELGKGFLAAGLSVIDVGILPTPAVVKLISQHQAHGAVVITASHNPATDNGFKFFNRYGLKLLASQEEEIEAVLAGAQEPAFVPAILKNIQREKMDLAANKAMAQICRGYWRTFQGLFRHDIFHADQTVVLDLANGAANSIFPALFQNNLTFRPSFCVKYLGTDTGPDAINQQCGSTHPQALQKAVLQHQAAWGAAFDGDADRIILVDDQGELINGDGILYLMALLGELQETRPQAVVGTILTNLGLEKALAEKGIILYRTPVGDRFVLEKMRSEKGSWLGGETSGHIIDLRRSSTGDGVLILLSCLELMAKTGKTWRELLSPLKLYPQYNAQIPWRGHLKGLSWERMCGHNVLAEIQRLTDETGDAGRFIIRPSGTEPVLRLMVECEDANHTAEMGNRLKTLLSSSLQGESA